MKTRMHRFMIPALLAAAIPTMAVAQAQQEPAAKGNERGRMERLSPEARARLQEWPLRDDQGDPQAQRWAAEAVGARRSADAGCGHGRRSKRVPSASQMRQQQGAQQPSLADRLDRASQRMAKRAEQMKAFADAFKPFYAALNDEQKTLAGVVLHREHGGRRGHG